MSTKIFDGKAFAAQREATLKDEIVRLGLTPRIGSVMFREDAGSVLYTRLKKQAAVRVGIEFSEQEESMREDLKVLQDKIRIYSHREDVSGVLIQKPTKEVWMQTTGIHDPIKFDAWWQQLIGILDAKKDVDCLTNENLGRVYLGKWVLLPATVKAVLLILREALGDEGVAGRKVAIIGRSELMGRPLAAVLESYGAYVGMFGASNMDRKAICQADVVISATGVPKLVTEDLIKEGDIVIDVGAPKGDVDFESVVKKAGFITPVPGGVGPVTVVSLLENLVELVKMR